MLTTTGECAAQICGSLLEAEEVEKLTETLHKKQQFKDGHLGLGLLHDGMNMKQSCTVPGPGVISMYSSEELLGGKCDIWDPLTILLP